MFHLKVFSLLVIFCFSSISQGSIRPSEVKRYTPHKHDIKSARHFAQLIKKIDSDTYKISHIKNILDTDKKKTFISYTKDFNFLKKLKKSDSFEKMISSCSGRYTVPRARTFKTLMQKSIAKLCHNKTLGYLQKEPSLISQKTVQEYVLNNLIFLSSSRPQTLGKILEEFMMKDQDKYLYFTNEIYKKYMQEGHRPSYAILSFLPPNEQFTQYLQLDSDNLGNYRKIYDKELSNLYRGIRSSLNTPRELRKKINEYVRFYLLNKQNISTDRVLRQVEILARKLGPKKYTNDAKKLISSFIKVFDRDSEQEHDLLFNYLWVDLINDNFKNAGESLTKLGLLQRYSNLSNSLKFWIPYIIRKNGDTNKAKTLYLSFIEEGDINYYSILAHKEMSLISNSTAKPEIKKLGKQKNYHFAHHETMIIKRMLTWLELDYISFAELEMKELILSMKRTNKKSLIYKVSEILNHHDQYLFTFKTIYKALNDNMIAYNDQIVKNLFPTAFFKDIQKLSEEIDPIVVLSLVRQESAFDPKAKSRVGARGLMQLMPATARQFKKKLKIRNLTKPKVNLKIGIKYLTGLLNKYEGNIIHALSAYNAGEGRVKSWKREYFKSSDPLVNVEAIPFEETQKYVKLIYRNIYFYKNIMNQDIKFKSLKETFFVARN